MAALMVITIHFHIFKHVKRFQDLKGTTCFQVGIIMKLLLQGYWKTRLQNP